MKKAKNKISGVLMILVGLALLALGIWLFTKVWGTALLYTDAVLGRVAAYYWIALLAGLIAIIIGIILFGKKSKQPEQTVGEQTVDEEKKVQEDKVAELKIADDKVSVEKDIEKAPEESAQKEIPDTKKIEMVLQERVSETVPDPVTECPNCKAALKEGMKFCTKCGYKL